MLLFAIFPYLLFRLMSLTTRDREYDEWKMYRYGKADKNFTIRKLFYLLKKAEKLGLKNAQVKQRSFHHDLQSGQVSIDNYLKIKIESHRFTYQVELVFNGQTIASYKGYSFQSIQWDLEDAPEVKKSVARFLKAIEIEFEKTEKEQKRKREIEKQTKEEEAKQKARESLRLANQLKAQEEQRQREALKEARKVYKKDMSI